MWVGRRLEMEKKKKKEAAEELDFLVMQKIEPEAIKMTNDLEARRDYLDLQERDLEAVEWKWEWKGEISLFLKLEEVGTAKSRRCLFGFLPKIQHTWTHLNGKKKKLRDKIKKF